MRLTRNYLKHAWLIFMLMGNSPACDESFFNEKKPEFLTLTPAHTYYAPYACSLRMSRVGYQSQVQDNIRISYNSLDHYIRDLQIATTTPSPTYEAITQAHGPDAQLNPNLLQIEAELYSPIRPKQISELCERPTRALQARGIQYIEVRGIDVNPLSPIGITAEQIYFLDTFLLFCLLHNSPTFSQDKAMQWHNNQSTAVLEGLKPDVLLNKGDRPITATLWGKELFEQLLAVAQLLDTACSGTPHGAACQAYENAFMRRSTLPAAEQLQAITQGTSFLAYGQAIAEEHHQTLMSHKLSPALQSAYEAISRESLLKQKVMENKGAMSYAEYLSCYFS